MEGKKSALLTSDMEQVALLIQECREAISKHLDVDALLLYPLELCLYEAVVNVIEHTYHGALTQPIEVRVLVESDRLSFTVIDEGDSLPSALLNGEWATAFAHADTPPEDHLGLFLLYRLMDEVSFRRETGKNICTFRKHLKIATKLDIRGGYAYDFFLVQSAKRCLRQSCPTQN